MMRTVHKFYNQAYTYLLNFLELQLFITLISLPLLIYWGLAISSMSLIANFIFTPLLFLFLWTSTMMMTSIIFGFHCVMGQTILHMLSIIWIWFLSFGKPTFLIGFSNQMMLPSIGILCIIIYTYTRFKLQTSSAILFLSTCFFILLTIRYCIKKDQIIILDSMSIMIVQLKNHTYLIDCGGVCSKKNYYSYIDYTLLPTLIKTMGITTVDTLILCKPSNRLAKITQQLIQQLNISTVVITQKLNCYKTLQLMYANTPVKIIPLKHN